VTSDPRLHLQALADALPADGAATVPVAWLRALLANRSATPVAEPTEHMLTAEEVADLLSTPKRWIYNHAHQLGGKHLSRRCLRFPESAVQRYLERRR